MAPRLRARPRPSGLGAYEYWILWSLNENGGQQMVDAVYDAIREHLWSQFTDREKEKTKDGREYIWQNETRFAVINMKVDGRLKRTRKGNPYLISEKGKDWLQKNPVAPRHGHAVDDSEDFI